MKLCDRDAIRQHAVQDRRGHFRIEKVAQSQEYSFSQI